MSRISHSCAVGPRETFEDTMLASTLHAAGDVEASILVVCDGAGGESHEEVASALAIVQIQTVVTGHLTSVLGPGGTVEPDGRGVREAVGRALSAANDAIVDWAVEQPQLSGMATTAVCAVVLSDSLVVGWAGDSRCYRYHAGQFRQITRDHSEIAELLASGRIRQEEAPDHPAAHTITRFLGQGPSFQPQVCTTPIATDDIVVLCTDGLTDVLSSADIRTFIETYRCGSITFDDLPRGLVRAAVRNGTTDNTTVLCYEHGRAPSFVPTPTDRTVTDGYVLSIARSLHPQPQPRKEALCEHNTR